MILLVFDFLSFLLIELLLFSIISKSILVSLLEIGFVLVLFLLLEEEKISVEFSDLKSFLEELKLLLKLSFNLNSIILLISSKSKSYSFV